MTVEDASLQQRLDEVGSILISGDTDRIQDLYTEDGQILPPGHDIVTGRGSIAEFWQGVRDAGVNTIDIETVEAEEYGATASRVGRGTLEDADGTTVDQIKFIELWKQDDGDWKIHRDIWNSSTGDEQ